MKPITISIKYEKEIVDKALQAQSDNKCSEYLRGLNNGLVLARALRDKTEPIFLYPQDITRRSDFLAFFTIKKGVLYENCKDGVIYSFNNTIPKRILSKMFSYIQYVLWKVGIDMHNPISKDCTPDFSCCNEKGTSNSRGE